MAIYLQQFIVLVIIIYCVNMIYFYFRNKSKKYKNLPTIEMNYMISMYGINVYSLGIKLVQKHISFINAIIVSIDLLVYFNIDNVFIRLLSVFIITVVLVYLLYNLLCKRYKKMYFR